MGSAASIEQKHNIDANKNKISSEKVVETSEKINNIFNFYKNIYDIGDSLLSDKF